MSNRVSLPMPFNWTKVSDEISRVNISIEPRRKTGIPLLFSGGAPGSFEVKLAMPFTRVVWFRAGVPVVNDGGTVGPCIIMTPSVDCFRINSPNSGEYVAYDNHTHNVSNSGPLIVNAPDEQAFETMISNFGATIGVPQVSGILPILSCGY